MHVLLQFRWSRDLRTRFDESQLALGKLQNECLDVNLGRDLEQFLQVNKQFTSVSFLTLYVLMDSSFWLYKYTWDDPLFILSDHRL